MKRFSFIKANIKELIIKNQFILYLGVFLLAFFIYLWLQATPTFLDPDSFYHLKMSKLIAERGPILNFPWLQFTVLKEYYVDHHFLYHLAAIPFIKIFGDLPGFKLYTVFLATFFIFFAYVFFRKYKIKYAEIFILALLFAPAFMFRISLAKATAFSLIILFLGIYSIFKRRYWLLGLISMLYVWSYGGFVLILLMAGLFVLADALQQIFIETPYWFKLKQLSRLAKLKNYAFVFLKNIFRLENIKLILASWAGVLIGLVLNPYFPKNLLFYWQQLVQIGIINYRGLVNVGGEWYPYKLADLAADSGAAIILGAVSIILFFIFYKRQKAENIFFFLAAMLFFLLTLKSKRYVEYFMPFLVFFSAFIFKTALTNFNLKEWLQNFKKDSHLIGILIKVVLIYLAIIFPLLIVKDSYVTKKSYRGGIKFATFSGIAHYLETKTKPGEIIMHTDWDDFPPLFYYNDKDYYIMGLDPTFMYNYNPDLYNLFADITMAKKADNLCQEIRQKFNSSYFIVDADRPQLAKNLQNDGNFIKVYEDQDGSIYAAKDVLGPGTGEIK